MVAVPVTVLLILPVRLPVTLPVKLPVTLPVRGPTKEVAVTIPALNPPQASLETIVLTVLVVEELSPSSKSASSPDPEPSLPWCHNLFQVVVPIPFVER